jgi:MoxR-like ATPase
MAAAVPASVDECAALLRKGRYVSDRSLAVVLFLSLKLERPLFLEGEPGVGKTEIAKVLAEGLGRRLIRLQCHEGLDLASALYEWNYLRQMLELRMAEVSGATASRESLAADIFDPRFLIRRPLLQALEPHAEGPPVLLIDEIDRADEPFEAFLLELLSDFQVSIPEIGTVKADAKPIVIITSNRTREIHDALKRRCLYHWLGLPGVQRELEILALRAPQVNEELAQQVVTYVNNLRSRRLYKPPGIAESLDWAAAIVALGQHALSAGVLEETLGVLLKYEEDVASARGKIEEDMNALTLRRASMSR